MMFRWSRPPALFGAALLLPLLVVACASAPPSVQTASPRDVWYADVVAMADAGDNAARRAHLQSRLERLGLRVETRAFSAKGLEGENLLVDLGGPAGAPLLLIGAHSDRVDAGRGATDNASGSAVVLALAERFRHRPLAHHRVQVAFWDLEERGLLGAGAYVAQGGERPALYVNFDVFGWGDQLWMMTPDPAHALVAASRDAARAQGLGLTAGEQYPPSDHRAFLKAGWPAVSYSLVGGDEIAGILAEFAGESPDPMPKVMAVIHSPNDTVEQIDPAAAAKGIDAIEAALRAWDAKAD